MNYILNNFDLFFNDSLIKVHESLHESFKQEIVNKIKETHEKNKSIRFPKNLNKIIFDCYISGIGRNKLILIFNTQKNEVLKIEKYFKENNIQRENIYEIRKIILKYVSSKSVKLKNIDKNKEIFLQDLKKSTKKEMKKKYGTSLCYNILGKDIQPQKKREITLYKLNNLFSPEEWKVLINHKKLSSSDIIQIIQEKDSSITSIKTINYFLNQLGYNRTKEEINEIKRLKSKTEKNKDWLIKKNTLISVENSKYKNLNNLFSHYLESEYSNLKEFAENELFGDYSVRSLEKMFLKSEYYTKRKDKRSQGEKSLYNFIKKIYPDVIHNYTKLIKPKEVDMFIPSINLAIEYNGDYWHSNKVINFNYGISAKMYHENKKNSLNKQNIKLIYIWESDWIKNKDKIKSLIKEKDFNNELFNKMYMEKENQEQFLQNLSIIRKALTKNKIDYSLNKDNNVIVTDAVIIYQGEHDNNIEKIDYLINKFKKIILALYPWNDINKIIDYIILENQKKHKINKEKINIKSHNKINDKIIDFVEKNTFLDNINIKKENIFDIISISEYNEIICLGVFIKNKENKTELKIIRDLKKCDINYSIRKIIESFNEKYSNQDFFIKTNGTFFYDYFFKKNKLKKNKKIETILINKKSKEKYISKTNLNFSKEMFFFYNVPLNEKWIFDAKKRL